GEVMRRVQRGQQRVLHGVLRRLAAAEQPLRVARQLRPVLLQLAGIRLRQRGDRAPEEFTAIFGATVAAEVRVEGEGRCSALVHVVLPECRANDERLVSPGAHGSFKFSSTGAANRWSGGGF